MIIHLDMDAFYASIEVRDNPSLAALPVVVGGSAEGRGVVSTANYVARQFGIHSAMPASQAKRLCPQAVFIKPRMQHYVAVSKQIRDIFHRFTDRVEPLSLDEAFIDTHGCEALFGTAETIAQKIKQAIREEIGLTASAGIAPNKFLAKVASDLQKPDGFVVVKAENIQSFLDPLPITRIWGIGPQTKKKLDRFQIATIGQFRTITKDLLFELFGDHGDHFWNLAHGIDARTVTPDREAKSISHETTFPVDLHDYEVLKGYLLELTDQVAMRLRRANLVGKSLHLKLRFSNFETITRSRTLTTPTHSSEPLAQSIVALLDAERSKLHRGVRLIGMGVSQLKADHPIQLTLFDQPQRERDQRMDQTADAIRLKFGKSSLARGTTFERPKKKENSSSPPSPPPNS